MFDIATREKYRFDSIRGQLTTEQLWDVPLRSRDGFDLDAIARGLSRQVKAAEEISFVDSTPTEDSRRLTAQLEVVKFVIKTKLDEDAARMAAARMKQERQSLLALLDKRREAALENLSEAEIRARLDVLDGRTAST